MSAGNVSGRRVQSRHLRVCAGFLPRLFVAEGQGIAIVEGARRALPPGNLLLIERGERRGIRATGRAPLRAVSSWSPSAHTADADAWLADGP